MAKERKKYDVYLKRCYVADSGPWDVLSCVYCGSTFAVSEKQAINNVVFREKLLPDGWILEQGCEWGIIVGYKAELSNAK